MVVALHGDFHSATDAVAYRIERRPSVRLP
jgi:hypothetical protein